MARHRNDRLSGQGGAAPSRHSWVRRRAGDAVILLAGLALALPLIVLPLIVLGA